MSFDTSFPWEARPFVWGRLVAKVADGGWWLLVGR